MSTAAGTKIYVNDEARMLERTMTLADLMAELGLGERKGVAAAINGNVVPRATWGSRALAGEDRVLVIRASQGG